METPRNIALTTAKEKWEGWLKRLESFIAFPSISGKKGNPEAIQQAADWLGDTLNQLNLDGVAILPTAGNPVVYAEDLRAGGSAPTVLIYGHYDVVEVEPRTDWESEPFQAVVRGEHLYGRGATDMKGQIIACLAAVEALRAGGAPPVNLKLLLEGEEENPPRHLEALLVEQRERLQSDVCLNPDAGMVAPGVPTIVYSLRGNMRCDLLVRGPRQALHTGLYGGVIHNPVHALSELIAGLHDGDGRVTIPGFYENVRPLEDDERALLAKLPADEDFYRDNAGVPALWGDAAYSPHERVGARPSVNVTSFDTEREKVVIPTHAKAAVRIRLVPDQTVEEMHQKLRHHVAENAPQTITWELTFVAGYGPAYTERSSPAIRALSRAIETVWGVPPLFSRDGGGIPAAVWIEQVLGVPSLLTGFASPVDNLHGPNERVHLPSLERGVETLVHFFYELAEGG
ncbi:MAG: M20/M25/M40 family metallo-hydrolase [Anaerolineales bacterium]|nr:M20/M25/M40 family metallo-hydrolase [Anaerolineales bacterium]